MMDSEEQRVEQTMSIGELSARTQVNSVTLRAWERRYGLLKPMRTAKGHRLYCNEDVIKIDKIRSLVARGVPLRKVKAVLQESTEVLSLQDSSEHWQKLITELQDAVTTFNTPKIMHIINDTFANYPIVVCREHFIEPVFVQLALERDLQAAFIVLENCLLSYTLLRLNASTSKKKQRMNINLIGGDQAPLWRLALAALELTDLHYNVILMHRHFTLHTAIKLCSHTPTSISVYFQDGHWREDQQQLATESLAQYKQMLLCGTAALLMQSNIKDRIFSDINDCVNVLSTLQTQT